MPQDRLTRYGWKRDPTSNPPDIAVQDLQVLDPLGASGKLVFDSKTETPTQRAYTECRPCGLSAAEIDELIDDVRQRRLTREEEVQLFHESRIGGEAHPLRSVRTRTRDNRCARTSGRERLDTPSVRAVAFVLISPCLTGYWPATPLPRRFINPAASQPSRAYQG